MSDCIDCCVPDAVRESVLAESVQNLQQQLPPSVGSGIILRELAKSMRRFCIESLVWRYMYEALDVTPHETTYALNTEADTAVVRIINVFATRDHDEYPLLKGESIRRGRGDGVYWYEPQPATLLFNRPLEATQTLRVEVALRPSDSANWMPPELYSLYQPAIESGALNAFFKMPDYLDLNLAAYHQQTFAIGVSQAKQKHLNTLKVGRPAYRNPFSLSWG